MDSSINTNLSAMTANLHSNLSHQGINNSLGKLSSDSDITNLAYNASGLGMENQLSARVSGLGQAIINANDSIGMIQVADGGMNGIEENMDRIRVLTLQASNGIMNADDRAIIQKEIDGLLESSDDIVEQTSYNGIKLLNGSDFRNTKSVSFGNTQVSSLTGSIDVTTSAGAVSALDTVDSAMNGISDIRSELGESENQLMSNIRNISVTQINIANEESQIREVDFAQESANFSRENIMSQIGSFVQAQENTSADNVARLFGQ